MTYYDIRFAQEMSLLFCLANTRMRHDVNQVVSAKVHCSGRAFEQFKKAINDEDFENLLKDAQADPKGMAAQDLLKKLLPFLNISSRPFFESVSKLLLTVKRAFTFVVFRLIVGRR